MEEDNSSTTECINTAFSDVCGFLTFSDALQCRVVNRRWLGLVDECLPEERCTSHLLHMLQRMNLYIFRDTKEWKESTQSDVNIVKTILLRTEAKRTAPFRTLLGILEVTKYIPMEAAIAYSNRFGRILIPYEEQVRCISDDAIEEPRSDGKIYDPCPCPSHDPCPGCRLVDNIPPQLDHVSTHGRVEEEGYSVDDFYTCTAGLSSGTENTCTARPSSVTEKSVRIELKKYFPVCVPNLPPTLMCPICRERNRRTLFMTEITYQSSEISTEFSCTQLTFTPDKSQENNLESKRIRREKTWKDRLFPKNCYPPAPYREVGIHKNVPLVHTSGPCDMKTCISIHCNNCHQFGMLAPVLPCHANGFPCETVRAQPQEDSIRDEAYGAELGAVLVRRRCNANYITPCFRATLCTRCLSENWHHVWEGRPEQGRRHAYLNSQGINFIVHCSSCRTCNLRLCHEHSWLATICHHS